jgi:hypothetical protein
MSIPRHTPTEREDAWSNVDECLRDIDQLTHGLPTGDMLDYAHKNSLGQEVIDGLEKLAVAASVLAYEGPDVIWDFAKAAGMSPNVATADLMKLAEIGKYLFCEAVWLADDQDNVEFFTEAFSFYGPLVTGALEEMGLDHRSTHDGRRAS